MKLKTRLFCIWHKTECKHKALVEKDSFIITVAYTKWDIAIIPSIELTLSETCGSYDDCWFIEFKWLFFAFAITFYGKSWKGV